MDQPHCYPACDPHMELTCQNRGISWISNGDLAAAHSKGIILWLRLKLCRTVSVRQNRFCLLNRNKYSAISLDGASLRERPCEGCQSLWNESEYVFSNWSRIQLWTLKLLGEGGAKENTDSYSNVWFNCITGCKQKAKSTPNRSSHRRWGELVRYRDIVEYRRYWWSQYFD